MSERGLVGPYRGFEHAELAVHVPTVGKRALQHYGKWLVDTHGIEATKGFSPLLAAEPGGETGAPETRINPIPRDWYHTDWVADRTIAYLDSLPDDADWFVWMSFPDPHHPWDPPASELHRCNWRDLDLPAGHPGSNEEIERVPRAEARALARALERQIGSTPKAARVRTVRRTSSARQHPRDQRDGAHHERADRRSVRSRARAASTQRGWDDDTDVIFTTDHGELQGDYGLDLQGPVPHRLADATPDGVASGAVGRRSRPPWSREPVGQLDLAPTFCEIAGVPAPEWIEGEPLPTAPGSGRERVLCEWDSQFPGYGMHLRTIYRDGWLCTAYEPSTVGEPNGLGEVVRGDRGCSAAASARSARSRTTAPKASSTTVEDDPHQWVNRWDDPECKAVREDLVADLYEALPKERNILEVVRPA